jgi:hypothetical protein
MDSIELVGVNDAAKWMIACQHPPQGMAYPHPPYRRLTEVERTASPRWDEVKAR